MAEGLREVVSAWDEFRVVPEELRELDYERVLVLVISAGEAKRAGWMPNECGSRPRTYSTYAEAG
jgi:hypothetical protein